MIKMIAADLDGVLIRARDLHYHALNQALQKLCDFEISRDEHESRFDALTTRQKIKMLIEEGRVPESISGKVWELKQKHTASAIEKLQYDPVKIELLQWLKSSGYSVACVTNSIRESAENMLRNTGQLEHIDLLISNQDVENPKPHPEGYIRAMIRLGHEPDSVMIIEDSEKGMAAARMTGARIFRVGDAPDVTLESVRAAIAERDET